MNIQKQIEKAGYKVISQTPIDNVAVKQILSAAEVSRQSFYRYFLDKYDLGNQIYYNLFIRDLYIPERVMTNGAWFDTYIVHFERLRKHLPLVKNLFSSSVPGCTLDYQRDCSISYELGIVKAMGGDANDPRIIFAMKQRHIAGAAAMREWVNQGMPGTDKEMMLSFVSAIPKTLVPYLTPCFDIPVKHESA